MQKKRKINKQKGFTLIELLVTMAIIAILSVLGMMTYIKVNQSARNNKRKADLQTVRQALIMYRADNGEYPSSETTVAALVAGSLNEYINDDVSDPKGLNYGYSSNGRTFTITAVQEPETAKPTIFVENP